MAALALAPRPASPAEVSVFLSAARPGDAWGSGAGGSVTITLFNLVGGELEGARQGGASVDSSMLSLSARAYIGPSIGRLVPYIGLGVGIYRQSVVSESNWGTLRVAFVGAKFKLPLGLLVKAEYQVVTLPDTALVGMDGRFLVGAGLSF